MSTMMAALRRACKVATGVAPAALVIGLGLPALAGLIFLAVQVLGVACWVIASEDRTEHVSRILLAWRCNANCLARDDADSPSAPVRAENLVHSSDQESCSPCRPS